MSVASGFLGLATCRLVFMLRCLLNIYIHIILIQYASLQQCTINFLLIPCIHVNNTVDLWHHNLPHKCMTTRSLTVSLEYRSDFTEISNVASPQSIGKKMYYPWKNKRMSSWKFAFWRWYVSLWDGNKVTNLKSVVHEVNVVDTISYMSPFKITKTRLNKSTNSNPFLKVDVQWLTASAHHSQPTPLPPTKKRGYTSVWSINHLWKNQWRYYITHRIHVGYIYLHLP